MRVCVCVRLFVCECMCVSSACACVHVCMCALCVCVHGAEGVWCTPTFLPLPDGDGVLWVQAHRQQEFARSAEADGAHPARVETAQHRQRLLGRGVPHMDGRRGGWDTEREEDRRVKARRVKNRRSRTEDQRIEESRPEELLFIGWTLAEVFIYIYYIIIIYLFMYIIMTLFIFICITGIYIIPVMFCLDVCP